jgi:hypothetical protein
MKKQISIALAAGLLAAGVSAASAAGMQSSTAQSAPAKDALGLSSTEQKTAWNDLNAEAAKQNAPPSFFRAVGEWVPNSVKLQPVTGKAASDVPALRPYDFAMIEGTLLIVNPADRKIAEVITR